MIQLLATNNDLLDLVDLGIAMQSYHISTGRVWIFWGFHCFGIFIHNDTMSALGRPQDIFSPYTIWIQKTHALAPFKYNGPRSNNRHQFDLAWWEDGDLVAVGGKVALLPIPVGAADSLVHHSQAFTIHVRVLILRGSIFS